MSYSFSATGLPPGLSLVGDTVSGVPTVAGTYTVTYAVSDGLTTQQRVMSMTIAAAPVPVPTWQLILAADDGVVWSDRANAQLQLLADSGVYWGDSAAIVVVPTVSATDGSYWLDSAVAAMATDGSYWLDKVVVESAIDGSYWLDSAEIVVVGGDAAYVASQMPLVPTAQRQAVADAALAAANTIGGGTTQYQIIDAIVLRAFNWLVFRPGSTFQDPAGTIVAVAGDPLGRANPWIGSIHAFSNTDSNRPILTTSDGATFDGSNDYMIGSTATYALPAWFAVFSKNRATFSANDFPGVFSFRPTPGSNFPGVGASNEARILTGVGFANGSPASTNNVYFEAGGAGTAGQVNGTAVNLTSFTTFDQGVALPNPTNLNIVYGASSTVSGSKGFAIGADAFNTSNGNRYWYGNVASLVWLNAALNTTEMQRFTAFFKALWFVS